MVALHECPKCGEPMEYQPAEPDVGIMSSYFFCTACEDVTVDAQDYDSSDYDLVDADHLNYSRKYGLLP